MPMPGMPRVPVPPIQSLIPPWLMKVLIPIAIVGMLIYFIGPRVFSMPQKDAPTYIIYFAIFWVVYLICAKLVSIYQSRRIERQLREQAEAQLAAMGGAQPKNAVEALEKSFVESLQTLKTTRVGKEATTLMPWYVVIGPPACGKSSALSESGLNFPSMGQTQRNLQSITATKNCDWWFTDEAIFLDTTGRYTTETANQDEWFAFLKLLKKHRRTQAVNGVIVCVSLPELARMNEEAVEAYAQPIRDRLDEMSRQLELVFPIYVMFTKCDQIAGFSDFFDDFNKAERAQVWGSTLAYGAAAGQTSAREIFEGECAKLNASLYAQRINVLAKARSIERKESSFLFPRQFEAAQRRLADFIGALFRPNPFQESSVFRGFYFSSATQKGQSLDLVGGDSPRLLPVAPPATVAGIEPEKKSFFLNQLFTQIVIPAKTFARDSMRKRRRLRVWRGITMAGTAACFLPLLVMLFVSFANNSALVSTVKTRATAFKEQTVAGPTKIRTNPSQLETTLAAMDALREELQFLDEMDRQMLPALDYSFGLYSGGSVNGTARTLYFQNLKGLILDRLSSHLAAEIEALNANKQKTSADYDRLYDLTQVYRMLANDGGLAPDPKLVERIVTPELWLKALLGENAGGTISAGATITDLAKRQREFFVAQVVRPLAREAWATKQNAELVKAAQDALGQAVWINNKYNALIAELANNAGTVNIGTILPGNQDLFSVPGPYQFSAVFTNKGWSDSALAFDNKAEDLKNLYAGLKKDQTAAELRKQLVDQYKKQYGEKWRNMLANIKIRQFASANDAAAALKTLSAPESPFRDLLRNYYEQIKLTLDTDPDPYFVITDDLKWMEDALKALGKVSDAFNDLLGGKKENSLILANFEKNKLQPLVEAFPTARADLDKALNGAPEKMTESRVPPTGLTIELRALIGSLMKQALAQSLAALAATSKQEADALWASQVQRLFDAEFAPKYPFTNSAEDSVPLGTFSEMFNAKSGKFWAVNKTLSDLSKVVIEGKPLIVLTRDYQQAVERATIIRGRLFQGDDGSQIDMRFTVHLIQRLNIVDARLTVGKQVFGLWDRASQRTEMVWRETDPQEALLQINIGGTQRPDVARFVGKPWGLFRLFDLGQPVPADNGVLRFTWSVEAKYRGKTDTYLISADVDVQDLNNPFEPGFFALLKLPATVCD